LGCSGSGIAGKIAKDTDLVEGGILDSPAFVELLVRLEQEFLVEAPMDAVDI